MNFLEQILSSSFIFMMFFLSTQRKQLLSALLTLEMSIIIIIFLMMILLSKTTAELFYIMAMLTFAATEASMGLAILVSMMRSYGSDMLAAQSPYKC